MLDILGTCMAVVSLIFSIAVVILTILIARRLKNGASIHFLTGAMAYAAMVRTCIVTNSLGWTDINCLVLGPPTYILLFIGFLTLYKSIGNIGKPKVHAPWWKIW